MTLGLPGWPRFSSFVKTSMQSLIGVSAIYLFLFMSIFVLICFVDENNNVKPFQERIISCWWMFATTWRWICVPFKPSARLALPTVSGTGHLIYTFFCYGIQNMK